MTEEKGPIAGYMRETWVGLIPRKGGYLVVQCDILSKKTGELETLVKFIIKDYKRECDFFISTADKKS